MIDLQKLRKAHELNKKNTRYTIRINLYPHKDLCFYALYDLQEAEQIDCRNIDDLIEKLRELTKPEPKYNEGTRVYWAFGDIIYTGTTDAVCKTKGGYRYQIKTDNNAVSLHEEQIYPSRECLIDAQLKYWQSLKNKETSTCSKNVSMECEHEYTTQSGFACAKCGHNAVKDGGADSDTDCAHESYVQMPTLYDGGIVQKCKKCGEFYR